MNYMRGRGDFGKPFLPTVRNPGTHFSSGIAIAHGLIGGNSKVVGQGSNCDVIITAGSHSTRGTWSR